MGKGSNMQKQTRNKKNQTKTLRENHKEMLEMKITVTEIQDGLMAYECSGQEPGRSQ